MAIGKKTIDLGLTSYDKLFMEEQEAEQRENIQQIPLEELHPFKNHPFRVLDDEKMAETVDSVREFGVLVPAIARPPPGGRVRADCRTPPPPGVGTGWKRDNAGHHPGHG